jgi:acyl-CoA thioester hydrolase|tara:strand:- start:378 stop:791 length:414 start_codon:yes stop_codon:yes gene_type:complete
MKKIHSSLMSVYYEDTDSTGYVYHSNYIKYAERARSNLVRDKFPELQKLFNSNEFFFVVSYLDTNFFKPARLSDNLKVETFLIENSFCSIKLKQQIFREFLLITDINVKLVWINGQTTKPTKIPENIIARFNSLEVV